jgi:hypothetical protein
MSYVLRVDIVAVALAVRKEIHRVKDIGFPRSVGSYKAVNLRREIYLSLPYIFEINQRKFADIHINWTAFKQQQQS